MVSLVGRKSIHKSTTKDFYTPLVGKQSVEVNTNVETPLIVLEICITVKGTPSK